MLRVVLSQQEVLWPEILWCTAKIQEKKFIRFEQKFAKPESHNNNSIFNQISENVDEEEEINCSEDT